MATIEIPKVRKESTIIMYVSLTDNGVTVDWTSLSEIKPFMYSDEQHCIAGKCTAEIVTGSPETLIVRYPTTAPQFLGQNSLLIRCTYDGNEKSFDVPVLEFVDRSSEATGVTVIEDPELPVAIEVQDVDTSVLDDAIAAALDAAAKATAAAELVPLDILAQCQAAAEAAEAAAENCAPVIGDNGNWWIYDYDAGEYVDSGKPSRGIQGEQGIQGIQGIQGNTGSSVDYPYELVNNLTTDDATKGLSAAQGVALKSEVSQLDQDVTEALTGVKEAHHTAQVHYWDFVALSSPLVVGSKIKGITLSSGSFPSNIVYFQDNEGNSKNVYLDQLPFTVDKAYTKVTPGNIGGMTIDVETEEYSNGIYPRLDILEDEVLEIPPIKAKTAGISLTEPEIEVSESGKFIAANGVIAESAGFNYSKPIAVKYGTLILVKGRGYLDYVSMIARVIEDGARYENVCGSIDSTVREYKYFVEEDGLFAFSWNSNFVFSVELIQYPSAKGYRLQDNLYAGIPKIGIIGDSLSTGAGYDTQTSGVHDNIDFAWWKVLERKSGASFLRLCAGGMSTRSFITNTTYGLPAALTEGNGCNLYIIALEVNDRAIGDAYLGEESDIKIDPDNNSDTFFGNYGKIIQKISAANPGCKFLLFTNPRTDGDFNDAIRTISELFDNCYLVDLWAIYPDTFTTDGFYYKYQDQSAHYPAMAYQSMANLFERAINDCINDNYADFLNIQYLNLS